MGAGRPAQTDRTCPEPRCCSISSSDTTSPPSSSLVTCSRKRFNRPNEYRRFTRLRRLAFATLRTSASGVDRSQIFDLRRSFIGHVIAVDDLLRRCVRPTARRHVFHPTRSTGGAYRVGCRLLPLLAANLRRFRPASSSTRSTHHPVQPDHGGSLRRQSLVFRLGQASRPTTAGARLRADSGRFVLAPEQQALVRAEGGNERLIGGRSGRKIEQRRRFPRASAPVTTHPRCPLERIRCDAPAVSGSSSWQRLLAEQNLRALYPAEKPWGVVHDSVSSTCRPPPPAPGNPGQSGARGIYSSTDSPITGASATTSS